MFTNEINNLKSVISNSNTISQEEKQSLLANIDSLSEGLNTLEQSQLSEKETSTIQQFLIGAQSKLQKTDTTSSTPTSISDLEISYPKLTELINRIATTLSNLGI
tara:strand:- start:512 stop:826 length:315 start_codon:yes stop_codon:yes gene_type:complete